MKTIQEQIEEYDSQLQVIYREKEKLENKLISEGTPLVVKAFIDNCKISFRKGYGTCARVIDKDYKLMDAANEYQNKIDGGCYHFSIQIDTNYYLRFDDECITLQNSLIDPSTYEDNSIYSHMVNFLKSKGFKKEQYDFSHFDAEIKQMQKSLENESSILLGIKSTVESFAGEPKNSPS